ncbi:thiopeptide-type bacteriocin biosynthesis protein [Spongiactinospora gelatinilytica]|nr:thiopeptide-type bacteriocin biosynthesis protein [Spongiactinospora gelatinilytica]
MPADHLTDGEWYQLATEFPDGNSAVRLGLRLELLRSEGALKDWWFMRKAPGWRLRLRGADIAAVHRAFEELMVARWWPTIYEPETFAFGGSDGMGIVHELFCADSRGVLDYLRQEDPGIGRRELSLLLINALLQAAGLDWFERGDVFARVAAIRPSAYDSRMDELATDIRFFLLVRIQPPAAFAAPWFAAFETAGRLLGEAAAAGRLERGLRAILTHVLIFHWNRFGLSATTQGILAHAAKTAILPRD